MHLSERPIAEQLIRQLHAARLAGDLAGMCRTFADDGRFEVLATGTDKSLAIQASSLAEFRPWLAMMSEDFQLSQYVLLSLTVEWPRAVAHWRVDMRSKTTGLNVPTELVDVAQFNEDCIMNYTEFLAAR
jgi:ketosteroid isomerase-like protein